jgi:hypothetical protein
MVLTFGLVFSSVSQFLPVSSSFFPFSPFLIQLILEILIQEFGTDCLGLVLIRSLQGRLATIFAGKRRCSRPMEHFF